MITSRLLLAPAAGASLGCGAIFKLSRCLMPTSPFPHLFPPLQPSGSRGSSFPTENDKCTCKLPKHGHTFKNGRQQSGDGNMKNNIISPLILLRSVLSLHLVNTHDILSLISLPFSLRPTHLLHIIYAFICLSGFWQRPNEVKRLLFFFSRVLWIQEFEL